MKTKIPNARPVKTPVQARSIQTNEAIFEATIQVLLALGASRLTTTKVADRAGVSVGTLYQYFPNKQALLSALLKRHLEQVVIAVEQACVSARGKSVDIMAASIVDSFIDAKFERPELSRVLYSVAAELGGQSIVAAMMQRTQLALCDLLASHESVRFGDLKLVSFVIATSVVGPVQALLAAEASAGMQDAIRQHLRKMIHAYLQSASTQTSIEQAQ
jgi:AcrR family transcriptional regulator